jgi:hypothetical protein
MESNNNDKIERGYATGIDNKDKFYIANRTQRNYIFKNETTTKPPVTGLDVESNEDQWICTVHKRLGASNDGRRKKRYAHGLDGMQKNRQGCCQLQRGYA